MKTLHSVLVLSALLLAPFSAARADGCGETADGKSVCTATGASGIKTQCYWDENDKFLGCKGPKSPHTPDVELQ